MSGGKWAPAKQWNRVHGDGKSTTGGAYHIETMLDSGGNYIAKIVGASPAETVTIATKGSQEPSFQKIVDELKKVYP